MLSTCEMTDFLKPGQRLTRGAKTIARWSLIAVLSVFSTGLVTSAPVAAESPFEAILEKFGKSREQDGIYHSNGRVEVQTVNVATKYAGRIDSVNVREGDIVTAQEVIAQLDTADAAAKVNAAKAAILHTKATKSVAEATLMQAESALAVAQTNYDRTVKLKSSGTVAQVLLDDATNTLTSAKATVAMAKAQITDAEALIAVSEADAEQVVLAHDDLTIKSPLRGRILYRLQEPGEVVAAGTPIVTMLDLSDVYMNLYLPAAVVGTLAIGDEARLVMDPVPEFVIPAQITFVSPLSQFTPKSVETEEQREELVFRVKLTVPRDLLAKFEQEIKTGVRGIGFVRTDTGTPWPDHLTVNLPD